MTRMLSIVLGALMFVSAAVGAATETAAQKLRVLVFTGSHGFERSQFFQMFKDNPEITFVAAAHPDALPLLKPDSAKNFDVLVTYDFNQTITPEAKEDFIAFLKAGKGLVVLHHAIAAYPDWPEYRDIIGARYYLAATEVDGVKKARSIYKHGVVFEAKVAEASHPVMKGLKDYQIHDETYNLFDVLPGSTILLTTDEPTSKKEIAWAREWSGARVVYIQGGHDHLAYENPSYRTLLGNAIRWVAHKD